jgi:hypothetical protein
MIRAKAPYRNDMTKLSEEEYLIVKRGIKVHPVNEKPEFRRMINKDFPKVIRAFEQEDIQLNKRFSVLFNKPKVKK